MDCISQDDPIDSHNRFDALRLGLALLVIFSHSFPFVHGSNANEPLYLFSRGKLTLGQLAVNLFFIISGYLISQSWSRRPDVRTFLRKRWLRIFPGYVVAALLCILVVAPFAGGFGQHQLLLVRQAAEMEPLISPRAFNANPYPWTINGSLWTIRYEVYCYMVLGMAGAAGMLRLRWLTVSLFIAALCLSIAEAAIHFPDRPIELFGNPHIWPGFLACFLAGATASACRALIPLSLPLFVAAIVACLLLLRIAPPAAVAAALPSCAAYAIYFAAFARGRWLPVLKFRADLSYGAYLYAFPVQQLLARPVGRGGPVLLFAAAAPITLLIAAASWKYVEQPFLRLKRRVPSADPRAADELPTSGELPARRAA